MSGALRGTSREKLYAELGWKSLSLRMWSKCLTLFFKIANNLIPDYARDAIPQNQQFHYSLRKLDVIGQIRARSEKFKASFYPHCLSEWSKLKPEIKLAPSVLVFKRKLLSVIRSLGKPFYGIHDPKGLSFLTQMRVGLSKLNYHNFKHNFRNTTMVIKISPYSVNRHILELIFNFMYKTGRCDRSFVPHPSISHPVVA